MIKIGDERNYLSLNVLYRNYAECDDYWDGNWLTTEINIQIGAWKGKYQAQLRAEEALFLKEEFDKLYEKLNYHFEFKPVEPWIKLNIIGNKFGQIDIQGNARDEIGTGNELIFSLKIDQTYLQGIISSLKEVNEKYPVRGQP